MRIAFRNARRYAGLLVELHSWLVALAIAMLPLAFRRRQMGAAQYQAWVVALTAAGLIAVNYALYLPYMTFEGWHWLRFMLPALLAIFVLFAGVIDRLREWLVRRHRWAGMIAVIFVLVVMLTPHREIRPPVGYPRILLTGHYLREALPRNAVLITVLHGGALALYAGRPILRLDALPGDSLDDVIADLQRHGYRPMFVVDRATEGDFLRDRFTTSKYRHLDWPARAEFASGLSVTYHDPVDRELFMSGDRWPMDVVVFPPGAVTMPRWSYMRAPLERLIFPPPEETWMFKQALEAIYRDALGRTATPTPVDLREVQTWMRRYLRYRVHECGHDEAMSKVFRHMDGEEPPPLCGRPADIGFPARDEAVTFRQRLEERLRDASPSGETTNATATFVDVVGEAVWLQEYLEARVKGCSHADATAVVRSAIHGSSAQCPSVPKPRR